ncbi:hypothetical protein [Rhizohabitans arisaemae]|nr:hypothetical protein [Rhizohabitans arisaemae]
MRVTNMTCRILVTIVALIAATVTTLAVSTSTQVGGTLAMPFEHGG